MQIDDHVVNNMLAAYRRGNSPEALRIAANASSCNGKIDPTTMKRYVFAAWRKRNFQGVHTDHFNLHLHTSEFNELYEQAVLDGMLSFTIKEDYTADTMRLRTYFVYNIARIALMNRPDSVLIFCGVAQGLSAWVSLSLLARKGLTPPAFLIDCWTGQFSRSASDSFPEGYQNDMGQVAARFTDMPWVQLIKGFIPEAIPSDLLPRTGFLHLNTTDQESEEATLVDGFARLPSGAVVLHDKGSTFAEGAYLNMPIYERLGVEPFLLPTGQALLTR